MKSARQKLLQYSRNLRSDMTDSEIILWRYLRKKQILEVKFTRQKPIGHYIADFYAAKLNLVVEIDGEQHFSAEGKGYDKYRDLYFKHHGIKVLRFTNRDVFRNLNVVLDEIYRQCKERLCRH